MRVLFAGGGTAGHINPALAAAGYLRSKQPDAEILCPQRALISKPSASRVFNVN